MYVTNSELFPDDLRQMLLRNDELIMSGRPLTHIVFHGDGSHSKEFFFENCQPAIGVRFIADLAIIHTIPDVGHRHIPEEFRGTYPVIMGSSPDTGDIYRFGVRTVLNFYVRPHEL